VDNSRSKEDNSSKAEILIVGLNSREDKRVSRINPINLVVRDNKEDHSKVEILIADHSKVDKVGNNANNQDLHKEDHRNHQVHNFICFEIYADQL
jgi:hypothetical protein